MNIFHNLKTSKKISYSLLAFQAIFLLLLLLAINVIYFFIWYSELKKESMYDMNMNYKSYSSMKNISNQKAFKEYILKKNTIITPNDGETVCSNSVTKTLHDDDSKVEEVKNSLFYTIDGKTYIVVTREYDEIGTVSVLHDTTDYVNSQMIIIKISIILILLFLVFGYFFGQKMIDRLLKNLKDISNTVQNKQLGSDISFPKYGPDDDEIQILANALEASFQKIETQAHTQKQFLVDVAHEFKTPLMAMNSKLDVFEKSIETGKALDGKKMISYSKNQIAKLNNLIETLMLLSKLEEENSQEHMTEIQLEEKIKQLQESLSGVFPEKNITYNLDINKNETLTADSVLLDVVLQNLIGNAIKFAPDDIQIGISFQNNILSVRDNGTGIPKEKLENIWKKFYRLDTKREGFGIGLFLVKRICELHNWEISVESEVEKGTTFSIQTK